MKPTLEIHKERVCIRFPIVSLDQPQVVFHYWPTTESAQDIRQSWPHWIGRELRGDGRDGKFSIRIGDDAMSGWHTVAMVDGPKTKPIRSEVEDIPPPKTRVETRWKDGHWQKLLKDRGWVAV